MIAGPDHTRMTDSASSDLPDLVRRLIAFRDARDWRQFHSLKDLIVSLNLEAAELLELTQWRSETTFDDDARSEPVRTSIAEECADVMIYLLLISERMGFDLRDAVASKIDLNEARYPVRESRGHARKYTEL